MDVKWNFANSMPAVWHILFPEVLTGTCPVPPKQDTRGKSIRADHGGHNTNETSFAHILFATGVPKLLKLDREICRTAPPCLPRPGGVSGELQSLLHNLRPCANHIQKRTTGVNTVKYVFNG
jgi:hypothetical protein